MLQSRIDRRVVSIAALGKLEKLDSLDKISERESYCSMRCEGCLANGVEKRRRGDGEILGDGDVLRHRHRPSPSHSITLVFGGTAIIVSYSRRGFATLYFATSRVNLKTSIQFTIYVILKGLKRRESVGRLTIHASSRG